MASGSRSSKQIKRRRRFAFGPACSALLSCVPIANIRIDHDHLVGCCFKPCSFWLPTIAMTMMMIDMGVVPLYWDQGAEERRSGGAEDWRIAEKVAWQQQLIEEASREAPVDDHDGGESKWWWWNMWAPANLSFWVATHNMGPESSFIAWQAAETFKPKRKSGQQVEGKSKNFGLVLLILCQCVCGAARRLNKKIKIRWAGLP